MESIYREYVETVFKYLFCLTHDVDLTEELTQETFYQAMKTIKNFRGDCKISVWLCQIAKHMWQRDCEKKNKTINIPIDDIEFKLSSEENIEGGAIMKPDLDCMIIQDLLPNYIEKLTSDITNQVVEEHIISCEQCSKLLNIMSAEITTKKTAPKRELSFLKKIKLSRLMAAVSCILLALIFSYMLYASEYKFTSDKKALTAAITEYTSHGKHNVEDAYVLETKEIDGVLIAFFKDNNNSNVYGFATLLKGINMKYRLVRANYGPSAYSAVVDTYRFDTRKGAYYAVGGHNLNKSIASYGLRLYDESRSDFIKDMLKFNIENSQFLDIKKETDLQKSIKELQGSLVFFGHDSTALLDAEGNNITENYKMSGIKSTWGASTGTAELFILYVFISIVLILGAIFAKYFWSEK